MDVLSDLLLRLNLECNLQFRLQAQAPWGLAWESEPVARFHRVVDGAAWLRVHGWRDPLELRAGDFVVPPHGSAHSLACAAQSAVQASEPPLTGPPGRSGTPGAGRAAAGQHPAAARRRAPPAGVTRRPGIGAAACR